MERRNDEFDLKGTLLSNVMWFPFTGVLLFFVIKFINLIESFQNEELKLLATIIICISSIRLLSWIGSPTILFKTRRIKHSA